MTQNKVKLTGHFQAGSPRKRKLNEAMADIRTRLPTPLESLHQPDFERLAELREQISTAAERNEVIELAHRLPGSSLGQLFILLTDADASHLPDSKLISSINLIIRERACVSMYQYGWLVFQQYFKQPAVGKSLDLLCSILNIRRQSSLDPSFPLISDVLSPAVRPWVRKATRQLADMAIPVQTFIETYALLPNLPLGAALISESFLTGPDELFKGSHTLFAQTLEAADTDTKEQLLKNFFQRTNLKSTVWNAYCQIIYRQFGPPEEGASIWQTLKEKQVQRFNDWVIAASIGSHCRKNPDKARTYLTYASAIDHIEYWDEDTLLIYFPGFVIADHRQDTQLAVYYDALQAERRLNRQAGQPMPRHPTLTPLNKRRVDDAIRRASCQGIIELPFDEAGQQYTRIFLNFCIQENSVSQKNFLRKLKNRSQRAARS